MGRGAEENWENFFWQSHQDVLDSISTVVDPCHGPDLNSPAVQTATLLTKLPVEFLQAIAKELIDNFADLMYFSYTCVKVWEVAEDVRFLYLRIGLQRKSWKSNYPSGRRNSRVTAGTADDRKKLKEKAEMQKSQSDDDEGSNEEGSDDDDICRLRLVEYDVIPEAFQWFFLHLLLFTCTSSTEDRWMLRNWTKKEFVIKSKGLTSDGLLQALFSLISWSNEPTISMACDKSDAERMIHGPWAGDRIDVTLYSLHQHKNDSHHERSDGIRGEAGEK
ncbi:hypothetical protein BDP27DRAFT_1360111 [Rhodocollybia butyracea]|uniref:Uncharacterized protein n=1 Tax=Rhodocollybia butyracea TaxID=206335 RepID=A0A9P5Q4F9_9AGAR|nr:hypothetical protein BDP27DRAFT_1360111 [Rhodocollybia butyracea]